MKILVNTTNLQTGGALQIAESVLQEWALQFPQHEYIVCLSPQLAKRIDLHRFPAQFTFHSLPYNPTAGWLKALFYFRRLDRIVKETQTDVAFTVFGPALWKPDIPHFAGFANGYYLYNDSRFIRESAHKNLLTGIKYRLRRHLLFRQLAREAYCFWVETTLAKQRLCEVLHIEAKRVSVIGNTCSFSRNNTDIKRYKNPFFSILYLSAYYPHKNFENLSSAISILQAKRTECRFILSLPEKDLEGLFEKSRQEMIINKGPLAGDDIINAYEQADVVIMPSLLETFSANFPEAMYMQKPILCSDLPFARDICGDAALYFDPYNPEDIAEKIIQLKENPMLRETLVARGILKLSTFETAESRAKKIMHHLEYLLSKQQS